LVNSGIRHHACFTSCALQRTLGLPANVRVLIINADDFGMYPSVNTAVVQSIWKPLAPLEKVPSLLDGSGHLFTPAPRRNCLPRGVLGEVELELRSQIETVLATGLTPTHLDWHALADGGRDDIFDLGLAGWKVRRTDLEFLTSAEARDAVRREGIVIIDYGAIRHAWSHRR
jgi:predicted glycoside hydrolase/deacetylase ChbG (UPF0249 family)